MRIYSIAQTSTDNKANPDLQGNQLWNYIPHISTSTYSTSTTNTTMPPNKGGNSKKEAGRARKAENEVGHEGQEGWAEHFL